MTRVINIDSLLPSDRNLLYAGRLPGYLYVGRSRMQNLGRWGNRYSHRPSDLIGTIRVSSREEAIRRHREDTLSDPKLVAKIRRVMRDKTLVCWCHPLPCHADTYAEIANQEEK